MTLYGMYIEEYYKEGLNIGKVGNIVDNTLYSNYQEEYLNIITSINLSKISKSVVIDHYGTDFYDKFGLIAPFYSMVDNDPTLQTKTVKELINKYIEVKSNGYPVGKYPKEVEESLFYTTLMQAVDNLQSHAPYMVAQNPRYVDILNDSIYFNLRNDYEVNEFNNDLLRYRERLELAKETGKENETTYNLLGIFKTYSSYIRYFENELDQETKIEILKFMNDYIDMLSKEDLDILQMQDIMSRLNEIRKVANFYYSQANFTNDSGKEMSL